LVGVLVEQGHDPLEIAAVALKLARADEKQRPIERLTPPDLRPQRERSRGFQRNERPARRAPRRQGREPGMVPLKVDLGRKSGLRPGDVVSGIAHFSGIPGSVLGAIRIEQHHAIVDVPREYVEQVLDQGVNYKMCRQSVTLERAAQS
jgi:ATP-dependent RNA helicase DeaD